VEVNSSEVTPRRFLLGNSGIAVCIFLAFGVVEPAALLVPMVVTSATIALFVGASSGCTSYKSVEGQATEVTISELKVGDTVQVVTADAKKIQFTIEEVRDDELIGEGVHVRKEDIRLVSVKRVDAGQTAAAGVTVGGILLIALLIVGLSVLLP
jgi:hypothetical protein